MSKNLVINPNKLSQPAGATLALMGVKNMIPLWHGVQGCTALAKVLFISHFREPMPLQNTAIGQTNVIMGGDENVKEALDNLKHKADIIGLITTSVTETSGVDLERIIKDYRKTTPGLKIVTFNTPDFEGNLETGYTRAVEALLKATVKRKSRVDTGKIAVFPGPYITPGEVEALRTIFHDYHLNPIFCPDLGDSLFGYLKDEKFSPCSIGGVAVNDLEKLSEACLVISIGTALRNAASKFSETHEIPVLHYNSLGILDEIDHFHQTLQRVSGTSSPLTYHRQRQHYLDTLLDTDFNFHGKRAAVAGDSEFVRRWLAPLTMLEIETLGVSNLAETDLETGDYAYFEDRLAEFHPDFLIGNSHVARSARKLGIPIVRSGIPVTDRFGEPQSVRIGYNGAANLLMACANAILEAPHQQRPYISNLTKTLL